MSNKRLN